MIAIVLLTLATYRASHMITHEDGPFDLFVRLRSAIDPDQQTWIGRGLNCMLCVSFWMSALMYALLYVPYIGAVIVIWLAIAGAVALIVQVTE